MNIKKFCLEKLKTVVKGVDQVGSRGIGKLWSRDYKVYSSAHIIFSPGRISNEIWLRYVVLDAPDLGLVDYNEGSFVGECSDLRTLNQLTFTVAIPNRIVYVLSTLAILLAVSKNKLT